ncbi:hypothetical protein HYX06_01025 [Candidatus Woesearchaeota archaeon]|nr:hypothetical protein [Candidatus Woesearchaeota archaeon]
MTPLRNFEEFLKDMTIRRQNPAISRARSLAEEAELRKGFIKKLAEKLELSDKTANYYIENAYDAIMELIRAKMLLDGFKSSGANAHEAEVSYLRNLAFPEAEIRFANELRYFRNQIKYYGKRMDSDYAKKVLEFLEKVYPKLKQFLTKI